ncbi:MAG: protein kinase [Desmonostoc vinosum HA7617-LM4]|jgi:serine/threonine-protein kinase|nr:protein kinase [Desmonostoc vinosum HA7617-LM4]
MKSPPSANSWNGRFMGDNQRYRLEKRLGGGGMGEVYLATDTRVGQQVALKLLKDTLVASQEMRKRFEREISVCAALQSDHIVKISDCGVTPEGYPFYVMEYLRGQTLRELLLRERRLSVERTVKIMAQVCKGLQLAHQGINLQREGTKSIEHIQVVHRDLKPDNIFLIPTDLGEWVKILDFGVAKIRDESSDRSNITNITSTFIGTFRYAAPEQIQSDKNLDARGDIYSLGIILYEMLSTADPFGIGNKGNNVSEASWVLAHAYEPPKPLRSQPGCQDLPVELEAVVLKCLQKNPNERFASVEALNQALQAAVRPITGSNFPPASNNSQPQSPLGQGSNQETISRPLNSAETIQRPHPGSNHETFPRPLNPVDYNQQAETIQRPQPLHNQGSNHETLPRPLNPVDYNQQAETIQRPQPLPNQGANHETIPRPLNPVEYNQPVNHPQPGQPDATLYQPKPAPNPSTQPGQPDATLYQPKTAPNPSTQPGQPDATLYQPKPAPNPSTQPGQPDATLYQPKPAPNTNTQPGQPDATLYQPKPAPNTNTQPGRPDATLYQPKPAPNPSTQPGRPDATLYQPRSTSNADTPQRRPDATIFQPRSHDQQPQKTSGSLFRNLGIAVAALLVAILALSLIYNYLQSRKDLDNEKGLPNTNQVQ